MPRRSTSHLPLLFCLLGHCASTSANRADFEEAPLAPPPGPTAPTSPPVEAEPAGPTELTRTDLNAVLSAGPGVFLGRIEVAPALANGRFVGFRLTRARDLTRWNAAGADIHLGDVIRRVNGISVERPEGVMGIFATLREARELRVDVLRDGRPVVITQPIVDPSRPPVSP